MRVLHVEVGGSYGGTVRWLEVYLAHSERSFVHDILFYYPTPGAERLKHLARRLWTLYDGLPGWLAKPAQAKPRRLRAALKNSPLMGPLRSLREWANLVREWPKARDIQRILRAGDYDVVHVNNTFTYQVPTLLAARLAGVPVVAHMANPVRASTLNRMLVRLADCVVTVNRSFENELKSWGLPVLVRTCYNPVDLPPADGAVVAALRSSLLRRGERLVGSVGRLDTQKGFQDLIRAARRVVDARPDVKFAIVGEGLLRPALERLIAELGLTEKFQLCGFRADVQNFLGAVDVFVCSSLWEGGPLSVVEAMLAGKPVVATAVGVSPEVVLPGRTGELVPPSDPARLTQALLAALEKTKNRLYHPEEIRQRVEPFADPITNAHIFDEIVEHVADAKSANRQSTQEVAV